MITLIGLAKMISKQYESVSGAGTVIILNGPSCAGKSSIIKAFQAKQSAPWLSIGIDNFFVAVLPPKFYLEDKPEQHAVMQGIASTDELGNKIFTLKIGAEGQKIIKGMHNAIADYAKAGNNVIVDYINYDDTWIADFTKALHGVKVLWVGVTASLKSIEVREKMRGRANVEGHARSHYNTVHQGVTYDLMLDTDKLTSEQAADKIIKLLQNIKK